MRSWGVLLVLLMGCPVESSGLPRNSSGPDGGCVPLTETCNGEDDDCDGSTDEDFALRTDPLNCGSCDNVCADSPRALATCVAGNCNFDCEAGFGDCDGNPDNGCEANLSAPTTCGDCDTSCNDAAPLCDSMSGRCVLSCMDPAVECEGSCVDVRSDLSNCGSCGRVCPDRPQSTVACQAGNCAIAACTDGFGDCDSQLATGCETDLTDPTSCGRCGNVCVFPNAESSCSATRRCAIGACTVGFGNCDGSDVNGCEQTLDTTTHCGGCGAACNPPNATGDCVAGSCTISSCMGSFLDCDGDASTGCEAVLGSGTHCGACNDTCAGGDTCIAGTCGGCPGNCSCSGGCQTSCDTCRRSSPCLCTAGCSCAFECPGGGACTATCTGAGSVCDIDNDNTSGADTFFCEDGADCTIDGSNIGSPMTVICTGAGTLCDVSCSSAGSACTVRCEDDASCILDCSSVGASCDIDCTGTKTTAGAKVCCNNSGC